MFEDDPMLELFDLSGDEDYSDYKLLKFDPKTWTPSVVFEIQPLIKSLDNPTKVSTGDTHGILQIFLYNDRARILR